MEVICTLVIMLPGGYREVLSARGIDLDKDKADKWYVDFTDYLTQKGYAKHLTQTVYWVNNNDCLIVQKPTK